MGSGKRSMADRKGKIPWGMIGATMRITRRAIRLTREILHKRGTEGAFRKKGRELN